MKIISWNCRGTNDHRSLVRPYMMWLIKYFAPMFLFLSETKATVESVASMVNNCNPTFVCGTNAVDSKGGLVV